VFCKNCGTELPEDSQFCRKCGQALGTVAVSSSGAAAASAPTHVDKPKPKLARSPFVVAGVLVLVLLIYGYNASQKANPNRDANPIEKLTKALHTEDLSKSALLVNAAGFAYFKLDVPSGVSTVRLQGNFTANGGTGNDVEVYVFAENDYVNWQNRHSAQTLYNSGKVTVGNFNVALPSDAGTYMVFNNRFSVFTQKSVQVNASLTYYQ